MVRSKEILSLEAALPEGQKPTLKTIAQMSGLAVPTVSRALNDAPDIGRDTKILVRRIADEIGYVPNRAGVRLRTGRTNVISLVMSTEHDNHTARLISSVASGLQGTRFHLNVTPYAPRDDIMKPVRYIFETRSADAVILNQIEPQDPRVSYLMDKKMPFATHGRSDWADQHPYYDFDNEAFGVRVMKMLAERGRTKAVVVAPPTSQSYCQHMIKGLSETAKANGVSLNVMKNINSDNHMRSIVEALQDKLKRNQGYDCIVAASTAAAFAAVAAVEALGMEVSEDIDVACKDTNGFFKVFRKGMLAVDEAVGTAGEFLARAVIQSIRHPELPPMQHLEVPGET